MRSNDVIDILTALVLMERYKQSSGLMSPLILFRTLCNSRTVAHRFEGLVASRTFLHGVTGSGALNLNSPVGGSA